MQDPVVAPVESGRGNLRVYMKGGTFVLAGGVVAGFRPTQSRGGGGGGNFIADMAFSFVFDAALEGVVGLFRHGAPKPHPELDEVVVIGVEPDLLRLRGALLGWEDHMPEPNGLARLAERVDELSPGHQG
jgi:hypothetical protein